MDNEKRKVEVQESKNETQKCKKKTTKKWYSCLLIPVAFIILVAYFIGLGSRARKLGQQISAEGVGRMIKEGLIGESENEHTEETEELYEEGINVNAFVANDERFKREYDIRGTWYSNTDQSYYEFDGDKTVIITDDEKKVNYEYDYIMDKDGNLFLLIYPNETAMFPYRVGFENENEMLWRDGYDGEFTLKRQKGE